MLRRFSFIALLVAGCGGSSDYDVQNNGQPATGGNGYTIPNPPHTGGAASIHTTTPILATGGNAQQLSTTGAQSSMLGTGGSRLVIGTGGQGWIPTGGQPNQVIHELDETGVLVLGSTGILCMLHEHCPQGYLCSMTAGDPELARMGVGQCVPGTGTQTGAGGSHVIN